VCWWAEFQPGPRRTAFVAARMALAAALADTECGICDLAYDERRPVLPKGHVSLSHGGQWAVAAYHPLLPVGVDVEGPRAQIDRVVNRVASDREVADLEPPIPLGRERSHLQISRYRKPLLFKRDSDLRPSKGYRCTLFVCKNFEGR